MTYNSQTWLSIVPIVFEGPPVQLTWKDLVIGPSYLAPELVSRMVIKTSYNDEKRVTRGRDLMTWWQVSG